MTPAPIADVAAGLGIRPEDVIPYGHDKAKIRLRALDAERPAGRLVLVSAITPTEAGEGKTTTSIALAQGLAHLGRRAAVALREPSLGPIFGAKGGATGGGRAHLVPRDEINLHFTGDFHAVSSANNLLATLLDNHLHHGNRLGIDPRRVLWRRVIDLNDRALRQVVVGLGGATEGVPRETGFDITPASEVMAALCLAEDREDLRRRLGRILVALDAGRAAVTAADLRAVGAMMVVLKEAFLPNLVQTGEGVPAFIHGGPFANIAHGCNSVVATKTALRYADWVVTEAGFGSDLGAEKFFHLKCRSAGLTPAAAVLVATVRALRRHGGVKKKKLAAPDPDAVERGLANLDKHVENLRTLAGTPVVALNRFAGDRDDEVAKVAAACDRLEVPFAVSDGYARGGEGAAELARRVVEQAERAPLAPRPLYRDEDPLEDKVATIAERIYGAGGVVWTREAVQHLRLLRRLGYDHLPPCIAKTQMSLSDDPRKVNRPRGFKIAVRGVVPSAGAGFVVPLLGAMMRMPGLGAAPQAERMDLVDGEVVGLS